MAKKTGDESMWHSELEKSEIVTPEWKCQVSLFIESELEDVFYIEKFNKLALDETRMVIKTITFEETLKMVKQIGSSKAIQPSEKIFQEANNFIKNDIELPNDIIALLIKYQILSLKANDINIKKAKCELDNGLKKESAMRMGLIDQNIEHAKNPKSLKTPKSPKDKVDSSTSDKNKIFDHKFHTNLRVQGEEWRDKIYIEDFPLDGSDLYIVLNGFRNWKIVAQLLKINIPLVSIVKIEKSSESPFSEDCIPAVSHMTQNFTKYGFDIMLFWEELEKDKASSIYNKIAFISFTPPYRKIIIDGRSEHTSIYNDISFLLYDIQDLTRQHSHYLDSMKILNVNEVKSALNDDNAVYNEIMKQFPLETVTIELILYAMMEQVHFLCDKDIVDTTGLQNNVNIKPVKPRKVSVSRKNPLTKTPPVKTKETLLDIANRAINDFFNHNEKINDRKLIDYGDFVEQKTFHIKPEKVNITQITHDMNMLMPIPQLWNYYPVPKHYEIEKYFAKLQLFHTCIKGDDEHLTHGVLEHTKRLISIIICKNIYERVPVPVDCLSKSILSNRLKKLRRTSISPQISKHDILKSFSLATSDEYKSKCPSNKPNFYSTSKLETKDEFYVDELIEVLQPQKISFGYKSIPSNLDINSYNIIEEFNSHSMLQVLNNASSMFENVIFKYCSVLDQIAIVFFNKQIHKDINEETWHRYIPSPVCLKDFFDYTLEEEYEWVLNEEKIHDEKLMNHMELIQKEIVDITQEINISKETDFDYSKDMLLKGSLKYAERLNTETDNDIIIENTAKENTPKQTPKRLSNSTDKKGQSNTEEITKVEHNDCVIEPTNTTSKFIGYNLGENCIQIIGKSKSFFSRDGTKVNFKIEHSFDHKTHVTINVNFTSNNLFIHSLYNPIAQTVNSIKSFRFELESGINISFNNVVNDINLDSLVNDKETTDINNFAFEKQVGNESISGMFLIKPKHQMNITWPNGLSIESVWTSDYEMPFYIKQFHSAIQPSVNVNELFRIYSLNGEIVLFKKDGSIDVLCSDGSKFLFTQIVGDSLEDDSESNISESKASEFSESKKETNKRNKLPQSFHSPSLNPYFKSELSIGEKPLSIDQFEYLALLGNAQTLKVRNNIIIEETKGFLISTTDYLTGEMYIKRFDGTNTLIDRDGIQTTTYNDGSKIISYFLETEIYVPNTECSEDIINLNQDQNINHNSNTVDSVDDIVPHQPSEDEMYQLIDLVYIMENPYYASVCINTSTKTVTIDMPYNSSIDIIDGLSHVLKINNVSIATITDESIAIDETKCIECNCNKLSSTVVNLNDYVDNNILLRTKDSFNKIFTIDFRAECSIKNMGSENNTVKDNKNCSKMYPHTERRFFTLKRDFTGEEFIHKDTVKNFKNIVGKLEWSLIKEDKDLYNKDLTYDTIFIPIVKASSQINKVFNIWTMDSQLFKKNPRKLTFADLRRQCKKSIYSWMRPYTKQSKCSNYEKKYEEKQLHAKPPNHYSIRIFREIVPKTWKIADHMSSGLEQYRSHMEKKQLIKRKMFQSVDDNLEEEMKLRALEALNVLLYPPENEKVLTSLSGKVRNSNNECSENLKNFLKQRAKDKILEEQYRKELRESNKIPNYYKSTDKILDPDGDHAE